MSDLFDGCENVAAAVMTALGAASTCWSETPSGEFDSTKASEIGSRLIDFINERYTLPVSTDRIEVVHAVNGQYYWHRRSAGNNEIVSASGETYTSLGYAVEAAQKYNPDVPAGQVHVG